MEDVALIFAPHPDDAELGMGGTISALIQQGVRVVVADLTDGEPTPFGSPEIRARETKKASEILGIKERLQVGLTNRELFDTVDSRKKVAAVIRLVKPALLFSPYWEDAHPDHVHASSLVDAARFYAKFVKCDLPHEPWYPKKQFYYFSNHLRVKFQPSFIFDISPYLEIKMAAILAYESQISNIPRQTIFDGVKNECFHWGAQIKVLAGEPFVCKENLRISSSAALFEL